MSASAKKAAWKCSRRPRGGKLLCRVCGAAVKHGQAWQIVERLFTCVCLACKERIESARDTGWRLFKTPHGLRYHREIGHTLQLDVETDPKSGWNAAAVCNRQLIGVRCDLPTAAAAASAIEIVAGVEHDPLLPAEVFNG